MTRPDPTSLPPRRRQPPARRSAAAHPLAGLRVVDASRVLAGPYLAMLLGDLGADMVKIERPAGAARRVAGDRPSSPDPTAGR
ncbi:MAG TPA: CoA transferase [Thermoanaerobaculia bacterium]|nr:CoA transferase [Thermoanaerobaculia bacterium]